MTIATSEASVFRANVSPFAPLFKGSVDLSAIAVLLVYLSLLSALVMNR
jgi:hypothetical protein